MAFRCRFGCQAPFHKLPVEKINLNNYHLEVPVSFILVYYSMYISELILGNFKLKKVQETQPTK